MSKKKIVKKINSYGNYGVYRILQECQVQTSYGQLYLPRNDIIFAPNNINIPKKEEESYFKNINNNNLTDDSSLLIIRYGGIGDIISTLFGICELKKKYKNLFIGYVASPSYSKILESFPSLINRIYPPIVPFKEIKKYKYIAILDDTLEIDKKAKEISIHQIYAKYLKIDNINISINDIISINMNVQKTETKSGIGIQYRCDAIHKNYNIENVIKLINELTNLDNVFLLGRPGDTIVSDYIISQIKNYNKIYLSPAKDLLEQLNFISGLKGVVGMDSGMLHMAGICNTPLVGLFGPFPSQLYVSHYNHSIGIDGKTSCSPCFRHFPLQFCPETCGEGVCINNINPEKIIPVVEAIL